MKRKRNVLAMLGWYDHRILTGIARYAREADWHLPSRHLYDVSVPHGWKGDGLLVTHGTNPGFWPFVCRQSRRQPTVLIGGNSFGLSVPTVTEDDAAIGQMAARHFLERGHQNFAWFSPVSGGLAVDRLRGFHQTLVAAGLDCTVLEPPEAGRTARSAPRPYRNWLTRKLHVLPKPLALFVLDDQVAAEVIEICLESHLSVPQNVAVLGVGNLTIACEYSHVGISSIEIDFDEMGYRAAEMLDGLMGGGTISANQLILPPLGVVKRRSTDIQASVHPKVLEAIQFIRDHFHLPLQAGDIADEVGIARRTLSQLFARELRESPAAHLLHVRLERTKTLLRETNLKVRQIAETSGLESERNLRRAFRREIGISPLEYRQKHRVVKPESLTTSGRPGNSEL